jgi:hypothetical protein
MKTTDCPHCDTMKYPIATRTVACILVCLDCGRRWFERPVVGSKKKEGS